MIGDALGLQGPCMLGTTWMHGKKKCHMIYDILGVEHVNTYFTSLWLNNTSV